MDTDELKRRAAVYAVDTYVKDGMRLGLGTGSTMTFALERLGEHLDAGRLTDVAGVPTSERTKTMARNLGIPLTRLETTPTLDLCIDGADEVDPVLDLIKGLGGALLREKVVALASREMVVVVDETKTVSTLGTRAPVPVEVLQFGWNVHQEWLTSLGCRPELRCDAKGAPYVTDSGNYIYDCHFPDGVENPVRIEAYINNRPGIVENGLFLAYADYAVIALADGSIQVRSRS